MPVEPVLGRELGDTRLHGGGLVGGEGPGLLRLPRGTFEGQQVIGEVDLTHERSLGGEARPPRGGWRLMFGAYLF